MKFGGAPLHLSVVDARRSAPRWSRAWLWAVLAGVTRFGGGSLGLGLCRPLRLVRRPLGRARPPAQNRARRSRATPSSGKRTSRRQDAAFGEMPKGPLQIVVSIDNQKVTLFSNGVRVAQGPVSTGVPGHPTPTGVFSIIEKDRYHRSNLYSNAPMPYMQRITWSGVALHEGVLPGYPASHGCIRMSHGLRPQALAHHQARRARDRVARRAGAGRIRACQTVRAEAQAGEPEVGDERDDGRSQHGAADRLGPGRDAGRGQRCRRRGPAGSVDRAGSRRERRTDSRRGAMPPTQPAPQVDERRHGGVDAGCGNDRGNAPKRASAAGGLRAADGADVARADAVRAEPVDDARPPTRRRRQCR